jgi:hypothetical protein
MSPEQELGAEVEGEVLAVANLVSKVAVVSFAAANYFPAQNRFRRF